MGKASFYGVHPWEATATGESSARVSHDAILSDASPVTGLMFSPSLGAARVP